MTYENISLQITLQATGFGVNYTITAPPTHGVLTPLLPPVYTYTPNTNYTGADSFTFNASSGGEATASKTVAITVSIPTLYVSTSGNDATGVINNISLPFLTPLAAYFAGVNYQIAHPGMAEQISLGNGTFSGIPIGANWNSNISVTGQGVTQSFLGGISYSGTGSGVHIVVTGTNCNLGDIQSNGGTGGSGGVGGGIGLSGGAGGLITITGVAGNVTANGGTGGPGASCVGFGCTSGSGGTGGVGGAGGTINFNGSVQNVSANGGTGGTGGSSGNHGPGGSYGGGGAGGAGGAAGSIVSAFGSTDVSASTNPGGAGSPGPF